MSVVPPLPKPKKEKEISCEAFDDFGVNALISLGISFLITKLRPKSTHPKFECKEV
jgi:hypothetical protein